MPTNERQRRYLFVTRGKAKRTRKGEIVFIEWHSEGYECGIDGPPPDYILPMIVTADNYQSALAVYEQVREAVPA